MKHQCLALLLACTSTSALPQQAVAQDVATVSHEVQRGESLEDIINRYGVTEDELKSLNPDFELFYTGMALNIPVKARQETASTTIATGTSTGGNGDERILDYIAETVSADEILSAGDNKRANKAYTAIIKKYGDISKCTDAYYGRALTSYNRGKWKAAIKDFETALGDSEFSGAERRQCNQLLAKAKQRREEQLERRGEMWAGLFQAGLVTAASVMSAKEAAKSQKSSSTSSSSSSRSSSSYGGGDDDGGDSVASSSSGKKECGFCGGKGSTIEHVANYGIDKRPYCDECGKTVTSGHYHQTCSHCHGTGYR